MPKVVNCIMSNNTLGGGRTLVQLLVMMVLTVFTIIQNELLIVT